MKCSFAFEVDVVCVTFDAKSNPLRFLRLLRPTQHRRRHSGIAPAEASRVEARLSSWNTVEASVLVQTSRDTTR